MTKYTVGQAKFEEVDGQYGQNILEEIKSICPDMAKYIIEFGFGEIYARPGLDIKSREVATVAALICLRDTAPQLRVHIEALLKSGASRQEVLEVIIQMAVYAGFPAAINALLVAKEVFAHLDCSGPGNLTH